MKAPLAAVHESGLALCVDFPRCRNSDALGSKADTRRSLGCIGRTRLTLAVWKRLVCEILAI